MEKPKKFHPSSFMGENLTIGSEEENELTESIQNTLKFIQITNPRLSFIIYILNQHGTTYIRRGFEEISNYFRGEIDRDDPIIKNLLNYENSILIGPSQREDLLQKLFEDKNQFSQSVSLLLNPIKINHSIIGLLVALAEQYSDFKEEDEKALKIATIKIANEFERFNELGKLRSDKKFHSQLRALESQLDISRSQDELLASIVSFCESIFTFDKLTIALVDRNKETGVLKVVSGFTMDYGEGDTFQIEGTLQEKLIKKGKVVNYDNLAQDSSVPGRFKKGDLEEYQFLSFLGAPITSKEGVIGSLSIESFTSRRYTESDSRMLVTIANQLGRLLDWWNEYGAVQKSASFDGLTNLLNHRTFLERFEDEIQRANRYQENLVLIILDLDKFKRINDTYGHLYGDFVLAETASRLRKSVRNIDIVARYGGEEFAIILINATRDNTMNIAKRSIDSISREEFEKDGIGVHMTISAGIAEYPSDGETISQLIAVADEAMYSIKRRGGNDVGVPT